MLLKKELLSYISLAMFLLPGFSIAQDSLEKHISFKATAFTEEGLVVRGKYVGPGYQGDFGKTQIWLPRSGVNLCCETTINQQLKITIQPEFQVWFNTFSERWSRDIQDYRFKPQFSFFLQNALGEYSVGDIDNLQIRIGIGRFLYKYNNDAVNLGEYLFRSGAYPGYLVTDFDFPYARLTGIHLGGTLLGSLRFDGFLTREEEIEPLHDYSVSAIAGYSAGKLFDASAGISLWRVFSSDDSMTTPRYAPQNLYFSNKGDTGYYSFSGIKLMGRLSIDPKALFEFGIFGKNDLKIFTEAAVLGVKNYYNYRDSIVLTDTFRVKTAGYYDSLLQRIPVMFGINLPAFKILDIFSLQFEYYGLRFPNSYYEKPYDMIVWPVPGNSDGPYKAGTYNYHRDDWKWSLYAQKTVFGNVSFIGQVANDHLRHRIDRERLKEYDEAEMLSNPGHWYWVVKVQYAI